LVKRLNAEGKSCFFCWRSDSKDGIITDEDMMYLLQKRVDQSETFYILDSENYRTSKFSAFEKEYAEKVGKPIFTESI